MDYDHDKMPHTYTQLNIHAVFGTKNRIPFIQKHIRYKIHAYMGAISKDKKTKIITVGGVEDHVHILFTLNKNENVAATIGMIKGLSSRWISETFKELKHFSWQEGYGAFSVSRGHVDRVYRYIQNQELHHRRLDFMEEMLRLTKE